jgi:hypothetical protein
MHIKAENAGVPSIASIGEKPLDVVQEVGDHLFKLLVRLLVEGCSAPSRSWGRLKTWCHLPGEEHEGPPWHVRESCR